MQGKSSASLRSCDVGVHPHPGSSTHLGLALGGSFAATGGCPREQVERGQAGASLHHLLTMASLCPLGILLWNGMALLAFLGGCEDYRQE